MHGERMARAAGAPPHPRCRRAHGLQRCVPQHQVRAHHQNPLWRNGKPSREWPKGSSQRAALGGSGATAACPAVQHVLRTLSTPAAQGTSITICTDPNSASGVGGCVSDSGGSTLIQPFDVAFKGSYLYSEHSAFSLACVYAGRSSLSPSAVLRLAYAAGTACNIGQAAPMCARAGASVCAAHGSPALPPTTKPSSAPVADRGGNGGTVGEGFIVRCTISGLGTASPSLASCAKVQPTVGRRGGAGVELSCCFKHAWDALLARLPSLQRVKSRLPTPTPPTHSQPTTTTIPCSPTLIAPMVSRLMAPQCVIRLRRCRALPHAPTSGDALSGVIAAAAHREQRYTTRRPACAHTHAPAACHLARSYVAGYGSGSAANTKGVVRCTIDGNYDLVQCSSTFGLLTGQHCWQHLWLAAMGCREFGSRCLVLQGLAPAGARRFESRYWL